MSGRGRGISNKPAWMTRGQADDNGGGPMGGPMDGRGPSPPHHGMRRGYSGDRDRGYGGDRGFGGTFDFAVVDDCVLCSRTQGC
jgi:hypothetical protein